MLHGAKKSSFHYGPSNYPSAYFKLCMQASILGIIPSPLLPISNKFLTSHSAITSDSDSLDDDRYKIIAWGVNLALNLKITIYTLFIILRFANFRLSTLRFRWQSIYVVFVGILGLVVYLYHEPGQHILVIILMGAEVAVSIGICVYVLVIVRRVRTGELQEMKMPGVECVQVEVELESGRKEAPRE